MTPQDTEILRHLQRDATLTHQALADATGMSAATVWRRVQGLEAAGLIQSRVALVDPKRAGLDTAILTEVTLAGHSRENREGFERLVAASAEILECYAVSGACDYRLLIRLPGIEAYEHFLMEVLLAHPSVATAATSFVLRQVKYTTALPL